MKKSHYWKKTANRKSYQAKSASWCVCNFIVSREKGEVAELLQVLSNKIDLENMAEEGNIIWSQLRDYDDNSD